MDHSDVASLVLHDFADINDWTHIMKQLQQSVMSGRHFTLLLILSNSVTANDRVDGVGSNDNSSIGVEKNGF